MDKEASEHGDAIPAQLLPQRAWVLHVQDLTRHQEDDSKWEVPEANKTLMIYQLDSLQW